MIKKIIDHFWVIEILGRDGKRYHEQLPYYIFSSLDILRIKEQIIETTPAIHEAQRFYSEEEIKKKVIEYQKKVPKEKGKYIEILKLRECIIFEPEESEISEKIIISKFRDLDI